MIGCAVIPMMGMMRWLMRSGFIWDHVMGAGLTFRNYGEFVHAKIEPEDATLTDIYRMI